MYQGKKHKNLGHAKSSMATFFRNVGLDPALADGLQYLDFKGMLLLNLYNMEEEEEDSEKAASQASGQRSEKEEEALCERTKRMCIASGQTLEKYVSSGCEYVDQHEVDIAISHCPRLAPELAGMEPAAALYHLQRLYEEN